MATATRYYVVTDKETEEMPRIVKASNKEQALQHVVRPRFACRVATTEDIVRLVRDYDVEVETAGHESKQQEQSND